MNGIIGKEEFRYFLSLLNSLWPSNLKNFSVFVGKTVAEKCPGVRILPVGLQRKLCHSLYSLGRNSNESSPEKLNFLHNMEVLLPEYFQNISIPRTTFQFYGIGQNCGNWIFQPLSTIFWSIIRHLVKPFELLKRMHFPSRKSRDAQLQ